MNYQDRLLRAIPGGAHTYSRGFDQFPQMFLKFLSVAPGHTSGTIKETNS